MVFDDLQKQYPLLTTTAAYLEGRCYFFKGVLKQIREINPALDFGEEFISLEGKIENSVMREEFFERKSSQSFLFTILM